MLNPNFITMLVVEQPLMLELSNDPVNYSFIHPTNHPSSHLKQSNQDPTPHHLGFILKKKAFKDTEYYESLKVYQEPQMNDPVFCLAKWLPLH